MLPVNLTKVAILLEKQIQLLNAPSRKVALEEWNILRDNVKDLVPYWIKELLAGHSLAGPVLRRKHEAKDWKTRGFRFWTPSTFKERITPNDPVASENNAWWVSEEIISAGYIPLSDESNGDMWIVRLKCDASSPVFLYDLSGWEIKTASPNLALFLSECVVDTEH